jgi:hypothetical protein
MSAKLAIRRPHDTRDAGEPVTATSPDHLLVNATLAAGRRRGAHPQQPGRRVAVAHRNHRP